MKNCKIKPYKKKDGTIMFYINDYETKVSIGFGERIYTSKFTKGQGKLWGRFWDKLETIEPIIKNFKELAPHKELSNTLDRDVKLYVTNIAEVAGHSVGADGAYFSYGNNLYSFFDFNY